ACTARAATNSSRAPPPRSCAWRCARTVTRSTRAGRSWSTPGAGWSVSSVGWPKAVCRRPRLALRSSSVSSSASARVPGTPAAVSAVAPPPDIAEHPRTTAEALSARPPAEGEQTLDGGGEGYLSAQRDAPVGGQAVIEGVMMRGVRNWAVAVRKPAVEPPAAPEPPAAHEDPAAPEQDGAGLALGEAEARTVP